MGDEGLLLAWFGSVGVRLLEWSQIPVLFVVGTVQRKIGRVGMGMEDGMAADDDQVFKSGVVPVGYHMIRMCEVDVGVVGWGGVFWRVVWGSWRVGRVGVVIRFG